MKTIFEFIAAGDTKKLQEFLDREPRGMDVMDEAGAWALHRVMESGNLEMAEFVVEYAIVNLNLTDRAGNTVLHYGVKSGCLELVKYLVERVGSEITQANKRGETPYDVSLRPEKEEIRQYFEEKLGAGETELYYNPVYRGMHPDPAVIRQGEDYYMVNSSFHFFPCIPISHSRDLIHWETIGYAITNPEWARLEKLEGGRGYWAPDISYFEGRYYITATYRLNEEDRPMRLQMVTSADRPEGPYCEPVFLEEDGIDPSIFTDLDGKRYMLLDRGARIFEISPDGKKILSKPRLLWYGENKKASEGPHLLYKDGYYYLFMAEGGTGMGHRISVARSRSLMGVYESCPYNPILRQWDENRQLQCCGHGMPVDTPEGDWYMVYLCTRPGESGYAMQGRETAIDPIVWTSDGWPLVNQLRGPSDLQKMPGISMDKEESGGGAAEPCVNEAKSCEGAAEPCVDEAKSCEGAAESCTDTVESCRDGKIFCRDGQGDWLTVRGFVPGTFEKREGELVLQGNGKDLYAPGYACTLLQRQCESCFTVSYQAEVEAEAGQKSEPEAEQDSRLNRQASDFDLQNWDAGLTCYYDENSYLKLGICQRNGQAGILAAEYVDAGYVTSCFVPMNLWIDSEKRTLQAELKIETENLTRKLYARGKNEAWQQVAVLENTIYLSSEGLKKGKRFTGAMWGVYVNGKVTGKFKKTP